MYFSTTENPLLYIFLKNSLLSTPKRSYNHHHHHHHHHTTPRSPPPPSYYTKITTTIFCCNQATQPKKNWLSKIWLSKKKCAVIRQLFSEKTLMDLGQFSQYHPHINTTTHIGHEGSGRKKIKIQNTAELSRNEASMRAEFLDNSAVFCIFIFFVPEPS